jgi:hypothetical protein
MFKKAMPQIPVSRLIHAALGNQRLPYVRSFFFLCAAMILGLQGAWAQEPATSLDQLNLVLGKGDKVTLLDLAGDKITGKVSRLGPDGLDLNVGGKNRTFTENQIRQITRDKPDSVLNGFLIGAGTAFGLTLPLNLAITDRHEVGFAVFASTIWGLMGGGIGALVDTFVHGEQLVYFRPRSTVTWSIGPYYSGFSAQSPNAGFHAFPGDSASSMGVKSSKGVLVTVRF